MAAESGNTELMDAIMDISSAVAEALLRLEARKRSEKVKTFPAKSVFPGRLKRHWSAPRIGLREMVRAQSSRRRQRVWEDGGEHHVYLLRDPRDGAVRYVGKSKKPAQRLRQHCSGSSGATGPWVQDLQGHGLRPQMEVVSTWKGNRLALRAERETVVYHLKAGADLLNCAY